MKLEKMTPEKVLEKFQSGYQCVQVVTERGLDALERENKEQILKLISAFGAGHYAKGGTCGAVAGALATIASVYGYTPSEVDSLCPYQREIMVGKLKEFNRRFAAEYGCLSCEGICNVDFTNEKDYLEVRSCGPKGQGILNNCPMAVAKACEIMDDIIKDFV